MITVKVPRAEALANRSADASSTAKVTAASLAPKPPLGAVLSTRAPLATMELKPSSLTATTDTRSPGSTAFAAARVSRVIAKATSSCESVGPLLLTGAVAL
jgi:hypothetical protein